MSIQEAKDPTAAPSRLEVLAKDPALAAYVAENPNVTKELLLELGRDHPEAFLRNPSLPVFLLEDPNLLHTKTHWAKLIRSPSLPDWARESLACHPNRMIMRAIFWDPGTPLSLLERLARQAPPDIQFQVLRQPRLPFALREELARESEAAWHAVLRNPNTPEEMILRLQESAPRWVAPDEEEELDEPAPAFLMREPDPYYAQRRLGWSDNTPASVLEGLARDPALSKIDTLLSDIGAHPNAPVRLLRRFAESTNDTLRRGVAWNPNAPEELLWMLARDRELAVHQPALGNPSATPALLDQMSNAAGEVRRAVAVNPSTPEAVLTKLQCEERCVKGCVCDSICENPNASRERLAALFMLGKPQSLANSNLSPERYLEHIQDHDIVDEKALRAAAKNPRSSSALLQWIAQHAQDDDVRLCAEASNPQTTSERMDEVAQRHPWCLSYLLRNPSAPASLLEDLLYGLFYLEDDYEVDDEKLVLAVQHPALPAAHFERLSQDESWSVRAAVAKSQRISREIRGRLMKDPVRYVRSLAIAYGRESAPGELASLQGEASVDVRVGVVENPQTPPEVLGQRAVDPHWRVREAVARSRRAPREALEALVVDPVEEVREAVLQSESAPEDLRQRLVNDPSAELRLAMARASRTTPAMLLQLLGDKEGAVRRAAQENPNTPGLMARLWRRFRGGA